MCLSRFRQRGRFNSPWCKKKCMDAAKFVMKPRPGLAIVKFWQGALEIVLRFVSIILAIATLITAVLVLNHIRGNFEENIPRFFNDLIEQLTGVNYNTIIQNSISAGGLGIGIALVTIPYELLVVVLRFLNIGLINYKIKIFLGIDIVVSLILSAVLGVAGVLAAYMAYQWSQLEANTTLLQELGNNNIVMALHFMAALAGASLATTLMVAFLVPWMILFLAKSWTKKVVLATAKEAVFS